MRFLIMSEIPNCEEDLNNVLRGKKEMLKDISKSSSKSIKDEYFTYYEEHNIPIKYQSRLNDEIKHYLHYIEDTGNTVGSTGVQSDENFFNVLQEPKTYKILQDLPFDTSSTKEVYTDISFPIINEIVFCKEVPYKLEKLKPIEEEILKKLSEYSSKLKKYRNYEKKIQILIELDKFLKENEDIIRRKFSGKLKSILRSL